MIHEAETLLQEFAAYARDTEHQEDILSLYLVVDPADERNQGQAHGYQHRSYRLRLAFRDRPMSGSRF